MLSIIISSYKPDYFSALKQNIAETIGIPYEIIKIDNPGIMGISEAYNKGAEKTQYDNLLFLHEDVLFHTNNWGEKLSEHLADPETGVIGIAGSDYVPYAPCGWYTNFNHAYINIIQRSKNKADEKILNFDNKKVKVYALDGVFLAMRKEIFKSYNFNEKLIGFHGYDTEISLRIAKKHTNFVISGITLLHFSEGNPDKNWFLSNIYIRNRLGHRYAKNFDRDTEYQSLQNYINQFNTYETSLYKKLKNLKYIPYKEFSRTEIIFFIKKILSL